MTEKTLLQRMSAIMAEIPYIKKRPKAGLPYPFVAHDDVATALQPLLVKYGVICLPSVVERNQVGNRCEVLVKLSFINIDAPTDRETIEISAHGIDSQDKGPGKALSYAVKMGLLKAFSIPSGEKDIEVDQIDHAADPELVRQMLDLIESEDGAGLIKLTDPLSDEVKIALWKEINTATKKKMRDLMAAARAES